MTLDDLQTQCAVTAVYPQHQALAYLTLGLTGEAGEVAEKLKKLLRDGTWDKEAVALELFDVLWYVSMLSKEMGYNLSTIAAMGLTKLEDRRMRGVLKGTGDYR